MKYLSIIFVLSLFVNSFAIANEHPGKESDAHHLHHNHIALFSGATSNLEHKVTDFSLGLDYEHRFDFSNNLFGIGIFGEMVFAEHSEYLAGVPIFIHPLGNFKIMIAPSVISYEEVEESNSEGEIIKRKLTVDKILAEENVNTIKHNEFLLRLGIAYDFHAGSFSLTPTFNIDFYSGIVALVYGFSMGYIF